MSTKNLLNGREVLRDHMLVVQGAAHLFVLVEWTEDHIKVTASTLHGETETLACYDADMWIPNNGNLWLRADIEKRLAERGLAGLRGVFNGRLATR